MTEKTATDSARNEPTMMPPVDVIKGTPGTTRLTLQDRGVFISEWSDATPGAYEFVEIFYNP